MTTLVRQQHFFQEYLLDKSDNILEMVVGTEKMSAKLRLQIYYDAYRIRLSEAIISSYPVLYAYLGEENFSLLANKYITHHPSSFRSIRWYGNELANFLQNHYNEYPYLEELARFEWSLTVAFDAADSTALSINDMAQVPHDKWADMRFKIHPAAIRLNFSWNIVSIWEAISNYQAPPEVCLSNDKLSWIIWRNEYESHFVLLPPDEAWAIDALMSGACFSDICEGLCRWVSEEDAGSRAASLLKSWLQAGLIINFL